MRCPKCGRDTDAYEADTAPSPMDDEPIPRRFTSADQEARNALIRFAAKQAPRRFRDTSITGFGGLL